MRQAFSKPLFSRAVCWALILSFGVTSCSYVAPPSDNPIAQRYERILSGEEREDVCNSTHMIEATAFSFATSVNRPQRIFDLDGQAQSTLIEIIGSKEDSSADVFQQIGKAFTAERTNSDIQRLNRFNRTVVISLRWIAEHNGYQADRISSANIDLNLHFQETLDDDSIRYNSPEGLNFLSWNRFKTDFGEVDLGRFSSTQTQSRGVEAGVDLPYGIQVKPSTAAEATSAAEVQLRQRYISLTGNLQSRRAQLIQQGASGIDVSGNVTADLHIEVPSDRFDATDFIWGEDGDPIDIDETEIVFSDSYENPVVVKGTVTATIRHVVDGYSTIMESDDVVAFCDYQKNIPVFVIIEKDDLYFQMAALWLHDPNGSLNYELVAMPRDPADSCDPDLIEYMEDVRLNGVFLRSVDSAHQVLRWLRDPKHSASRDGIRVADRPLCLCSMVRENHGEFGVPANEPGTQSTGCKALTFAHARQLRVNRPDNRPVND